MQSVYLVVKEFGGCFKGKFWCSVLLLLYLEAIYLPVFRKVCFTFVKYRKWIACGLHRFYIPELIRQTQAQELGIQLKLLPHYTVKVMLKYLVRQMQTHDVWQCLCLHLFIISEIQ